MFNLKQYDFKRYNITMVVIVMLLCAIGSFLIKQVDTQGKGLFVHQIMGIGVGLFIVFVVSLVDYHFISSFYIILYIINLILLILVRLIGTEINHSRRWLDIGISFQPSELSKIIIIIFAAKLFTIFRQKINKAWVLLLATGTVAVPTVLILIQTNLSTSLVIMFIFAIMIFAAGLNWKIILPILAIGIPLFIGLFWYIQQDYQILLKPYQQERVLMFINPELYPDQMFQQDNSVLAIGAGQLYGKVLDDSATDSRIYDKIPIRESDFIFSVVGEEFGFIGSCIIIGLYSVIIYICLTTAKKAPDYMGMLIAIGMASMFTFQLFVNIGVSTKLLPNTGIPLPFLSYGTSSIVSGMLAVGVILNIRLQPRRSRERV